MPGHLSSTASDQAFVFHVTGDGRYINTLLYNKSIQHSISSKEKFLFLP